MLVVRAVVTGCQCGEVDMSAVGPSSGVTGAGNFKAEDGGGLAPVVALDEPNRYKEHPSEVNVVNGQWGVSQAYKKSGVAL